MARFIFPILVVQACFLLNGCTLFSKDKTDDLQGQINNLRMEYQSQREENDRKLEQLRANNETLTAQVRHLIEEKQRLNTENQALAARLDRLEQKKGQPVPPSPEKKAVKPTAGVKVKVLSGNGNIASAKMMAQRLEKMGYKIARIDFATRSNFAQDTVFFSKRAEDEAKQVAANLGGKTAMRPITWSSTYDIIVVTGLSQ